MSVTVAEPKVQTPTLRVAVATSGKGIIDRHFSHTTEFYIYEVNDKGLQAIELRAIPRYCHGKNGEAGDLSRIVPLLADCNAIFVARVGDNPAGRLQDAGIEVVQVYEKVEMAVLDFHDQWIAKRE
jgi:predicted Fe-Mo cluster-binding NifX family protein